jgi:hypothetical protein
MSGSYVAAPTDDAYLVACKIRGSTPNSVVLEDGITAHWIGSSKAKKLILNFHGHYPPPEDGISVLIWKIGGGYVFPASPAMFEFMFQTVEF